MTLTLRIFVVITFLAKSLITVTPSYAVPLQLTPKAVTIEGKEGVWFPKKQAEKLLWIIEKRLPATEKGLVVAQEELIAAQRNLIVTSSATIDAQSRLILEERARANSAFKLEEQRRIELNDEKAKNDSFFRQPTVWLTIGAITAGVVVFLVKPAYTVNVP